MRVRDINTSLKRNLDQLSCRSMSVRGADDNIILKEAAVRVGKIRRWKRTTAAASVRASFVDTAGFRCVNPRRCVHISSLLAGALVVGSQVSSKARVPPLDRALSTPERVSARKCMRP